MDHLELFCQLHQMKCLRKSIFSRFIESAVQILPKQTSSVISCHNTIGVYHRNHHENVAFPKLFSIVPTHVLQKSLDNIGRICLSWVYPGCHQNDLLIIFRFILISDF